MNKSESKYFNTALLMNEALLLLLETKEYEFITVTEICKKAGVNRSTFYLHYETIDDLLFETLNMINNKFNESFNNRKIDINSATKESLFLINDEYLIPYLIFIKENLRIYKLIHEKPFIFKKHTTFNIMYEKLFSKILEIYKVPEDEKEYVFSYYSFGLVAIIQRWIENNCSDDIEKIVNIMKKVIGYEI